MLPDNGISDRCLDEGEVDIMEMPKADGNVFTTYHWMNSWPGKKCDDFKTHHRSDMHQSHVPKGWSRRFHELAIERSADHITFTVDGFEVYRTSAREQNFTLSRSPFFLILNTAVGGLWPGQPPADTVFPAEHVIDYVRVVRQA